MKLSCTSHSHTDTFNIKHRLAVRVWWIKFLSSLLNIYFRLSGSQFSLLNIYFRLSGSQFSLLNIYFRLSGSQSSLLNIYFRLSGSQSSLLNIYFRLSGSQFSLLLIHFRYGPNTCSHCTKVWHRTYPICAPLSRSARRSFAPLQKTHRNHRSYVWTEALDYE